MLAGISEACNDRLRDSLCPSIGGPTFPWASLPPSLLLVHVHSNGTFGYSLSDKGLDTLTSKITIVYEVRCLTGFRRRLGDQINDYCLTDS